MRVVTKESRIAAGGVRLQESLKKSEEQVPRGLKPARDYTKKGFLTAR